MISGQAREHLYEKYAAPKQRKRARMAFVGSLSVPMNVIGIHGMCGISLVSIGLVFIFLDGALPFGKKVSGRPLFFWELRSWSFFSIKKEGLRVMGGYRESQRLYIKKERK